MHQDRSRRCDVLFLLTIHIVARQRTVVVNSNILAALALRYLLASDDMTIGS